MKKSVVSIILLVVVALGAIYFVSHNDSMPEGVTSAGIQDVPPAPAGDSGEAPAAPVTNAVSADALVYELSDESNIEFTGYKIGGSQNVTFFDFTGSLKGVPEDPTSVHLDIAVILESAVHENGLFLKVLKGEAFFDIENHPESTFVSTSISKDGDGYTVQGNLSLRGITKAISFPAAISVSAEQITVQAEFKVDRKAWGIDYKGRGDALIKDDVRMSIDLMADVSEG